ncbi:MAG: UDP-N-acetylglucosamine 2-epimerase, partial [Gillisia sp.]
TSSVYRILSGRANIFLTDPVDYPALLWLIKKCDLIISDSGGIQEEAPSFGKPVIVTRDSSERMEGVKAGFAFLTGTSKTEIIKRAEQVFNSPAKCGEVQNPYGDGFAAKRIVDRLEELEWE